MWNGIPVEITSVQKLWVISITQFVEIYNWYYVLSLFCPKKDHELGKN